MRGGLRSGGCADVVYDVTLSYTGFRMKAGRKGPGPLNVFLHDAMPGAPECAFHMHVRRLALSDVDAKDDAASIFGHMIPREGGGYAYQVSECPHPALHVKEPIELPNRYCWGDDVEWLSSWRCALTAM